MTNEQMKKFLRITRAIAVSFGVLNLILMGIIYNASTVAWTDFGANAFRVIAGGAWGIFALAVMASVTLQYQLKKRVSAEKIAKMQAELDQLKKQVRRRA